MLSRQLFPRLSFQRQKGVFAKAAGAGAQPLHASGPRAHPLFIAPAHGAWTGLTTPTRRLATSPSHRWFGRCCCRRRLICRWRIPRHLGVPCQLPDGTAKDQNADTQRTIRGQHPLVYVDLCLPSTAELAETRCRCCRYVCACVCKGCRTRAVAFALSEARFVVGTAVLPVSNHAFGAFDHPCP